MSSWVDEKLHELVRLAIGGASMCWKPSPTGNFDSSLAHVIDERLWDKIAAALRDAYKNGFDAGVQDCNPVGYGPV